MTAAMPDRPGRWRFALITLLASGFMQSAPEAQALHTVRILHHAFEPESVFVTPGDTVRWVHEDAAPHTVTGTGAETFDSEHMEWGDLYLRVFTNSGTHDYVCLYHPMFGKVVVGGGPTTLHGEPPAGEKKASGDWSDRTIGSGRDALGRRADPGSASFEAVIRALPRPFRPEPPP